MGQGQKYQNRPENVNIMCNTLHDSEIDTNYSLQLITSCNLDPRTSLSKTWIYTVVYIIFLIFVQNTECGYFVELPQSSQFFN